ncbi:universal stress protein [Rhodopirellula bahusiensis]|uniref:Universal stress protein n=1 Tax=Rhodopirellula bahusiensis TaxID=2014065 RepID=A0A2G1W4C4_9BACT|nr:universal stress protein [Rhodopirellula bahusiensis]PHQ33894.1 universal stress protein [Rhodopirellula bahusiensis]
MSEQQSRNLTTLVGVDPSPPARNALEALAMSSIAPSCNVSLATVVSEPPLYRVDDTDLPWIPQEVFDSRMEAEQRRLQALADELGSRFSACETVVAQGHPGRELLQLAETQGADWIVLGSVGHSAIARIMLGSTSDYVANRASCTCLIHRSPETPPDATESVFTRVVVAISNAASDASLPEWIETLRLQPGCEVHLLHVMETHPEYELHLLKKISAYMEEVRSAAWKLMESTRPKLESLGIHVRPMLVESAHIGQTIVDYADSHDCDLIIVGDQDDTMIERVMLGSVSRFVVRHASQSVLIARSITRSSTANKNLHS